MPLITSKQNQLIKKTRKLKQKKYRQTSYLIEGWHLFEEAQKAGATFGPIFVTQEFEERLREFESVYVVTPEMMRDLTESKTPQGLVAEVALSQPQLPKTFSGRYLLLEDVQDPGNVGTMIRTADAAGLDGVFISDKTADIYNLKTLRAMQGSHFHLPIYRVKFETLLPKIKAAACPLIATTLSEVSIDYKALNKFDSFALVMGNEGQGISRWMAQEADVLVHISMPGQSESLNVAVAAGIMLFSLI